MFSCPHVSAFDLRTGRFLGQLQDANGNALVLDGGFNGPDTKGLWGIAFGNGQGGAGKDTLFFATGINDEQDGLFGAVNMIAPAQGHDHHHDHHNDHGDRGDHNDRRDHNDRGEHGHHGDRGR